MCLRVSVCFFLQYSNITRELDALDTLDALDALGAFILFPWSRRSHRCTLVVSVLGISI